MKIKISLILILIPILLVGCKMNTNPKNAQIDTYKYIVINSAVGRDTEIIKLGKDDEIVQTNKTKIDSFALGGFMPQPQTVKGKVYYDASATEHRIDRALIQVDSQTLNVKEIYGEVRATSHFIDGDDVYSASASSPKSSITKSSINSSKSESKNFLKAEIEGCVTYMYEDNSELFTLGLGDAINNREIMTVTKIDKNTLKSLDKFDIPDCISISDVVVTKEYVYYATSKSIENINYSKAEPIEGYTPYGDDNVVSEIVRYDKQSKEFDIVKLPFSDVKYIKIVGQNMYAVDGGDFDNEKSSVAKIDLSTNKIVSAINLPYYCFASYITSEKFIALEGCNLYEYDLESMKVINKIELATDKRYRFNTFITYEQLHGLE